MEMENPVVVSQGAFPRLREMQGLLSSRGIPAEIVAPPGADANA